MNSTAKLFRTGRSQAVRLPKEFRFEGSEVRIRREGSAVILEPHESDEQWSRRIAGSMDADWAESIVSGRLGPNDLPAGPDFD